jgi:hypothetical protein
VVFFSNRFCLLLADISVLILSEKYKLYFDETFRNFLCKEKKDSDLIIHVQSPVPETFQNLKPVFRHSPKKKLPDDPVWDISLDKENLLIHCVVQKSGPQESIYLRINPKSREWHLFIPDQSSKNKEKAINPLPYPLANLLFYYLVLFRHGLSFHASAVRKNDVSYVFTGFSGSGKSTIVELLSKENYDIIHDDIIILRKKEDGFFVYNPPIAPYTLPKKAKIKALFFLHHARENKLEKLSKKEAIYHCISHIIQHNYSEQIIQSHIDILSELTEAADFYDLYFKPDKDVCTLIDTIK